MVGAGRVWGRGQRPDKYSVMGTLEQENQVHSTTDETRSVIRSLCLPLFVKNRSFSSTLVVLVFGLLRFVPPGLRLSVYPTKGFSVVGIGGWLDTNQGTFLGRVPCRLGGGSPVTVDGTPLTFGGPLFKVENNGGEVRGGSEGELEGRDDCCSIPTVNQLLNFSPFEEGWKSDLRARGPRDSGELRPANDSRSSGRGLWPSPDVTT